MKTYYIADTHFGHEKCLSFDERPFDTIEEHDAELIRRWNNTVKNYDEVWILGDFSWLPPKKTAELLDSLNGVKMLCVGNHDKRVVKNPACAERFAEITPYKEKRIRKGSGIVLCHYPIPCFNKHFLGWYHLYGHVHMSPEWDMTEAARRDFESQGHKCNMINIGCMMPYMDYTPRTFEEIVAGYQAFLNKTQ